MNEARPKKKPDYTLHDSSYIKWGRECKLRHTDSEQICESVGEAGGVERDEREELQMVSLCFSLCLSFPSLSLSVSFSLSLYGRYDR